MRLNDISIGKQLGLGLGLIMALVALVGATAWREANQVWQEARRMYEHPFTVRGAVGEARYHVMAMRAGMNDLLAASGDAQREETVKTLQQHDADAARQLDLIHARYLGPRADAEALLHALVQWRSQREEVIDLARRGRADEAARRYQAAGGQAQGLLEGLAVIHAFASRRAEAFYQQAQEHLGHLITRLMAMVAAMLLVILGVGLLLLRGIRAPLKELAGVAEAYRRGELAARSRHASANELGLLAGALNGLLDSVQAQARRRDQAGQVLQALLTQEELPGLCRQLLLALMEQTGSQAGAVYLQNDQGTAFEHFVSVGLGQGARAAFGADGEGQLGAAMLSGQPQVIDDIPEDTPLTFATTCGEFRPRALLTIPVLDGPRPVAAICLASLRAYDPAARQVVQDVAVALAARINGALSFQQVRRLAAQLEEQNRELGMQQQELTSQAAELSEQNIELEMQKRQLDQANRLKSSFLANMSHELRTPLNSVIALSGVLGRRLGGSIPAEEHGYLEVIERNGRHLLVLINDLLDLARIEAGREQLRPGLLVVGEMLEEVAELLRPQAQEKGIGLELAPCAGLPPVLSDPVKVRHILTNLIGNAIKFTDTGGVEISAALRPDGYTVTVRDTGIGIAAEELPHIFDEFHQADPSPGRRHGGTGLGLAIAKKYAILLGGDLQAHSRPGQGSTFILALPLTLPAALATAAPDPAGRRRPGNGLPRARGQRILLVEDSEPAIIQLTDILTGQGYQVAVARDGRQALAQLTALRPQAVVLDLMMPEVDGFKVLQAMRATPGLESLPVLILTAKQVTPQELDFLEGNHIHQLIQKGDISKDHLLKAIAQMISSS